MKRIIFTIVFVICASTLFSQYKMTIKKADNTTEDIWVHDAKEITFTNVAFACGTSTITYAGQTYNTVQIGTQCWLKENLNVGTRRDGNVLSSDDNIIEKYCYDDNVGLDYCATYGGLYQWNEAMQYITTSGTQGICPTGWHIPTYEEFQTLKAAVNNDGNALKKEGEGTGSGSGTNTSGFSALLAGYRNPYGIFSHLSSNAYFWSSTEYGTDFAYYLYLYSSNSGISFSYYDYGKYYGFSVRCVKD